MEIPEERAARKIAATRAEDAPFATRAEDSARTPPPPSFSSRGPPGPRRLRKPRAPRTRSARRARRRRFRANPRTRTASALSAAGPRRTRSPPPPARARSAARETARRGGAAGGARRRRRRRACRHRRVRLGRRRVRGPGTSPSSPWTRNPSSRTRTRSSARRSGRAGGRRCSRARGRTEAKRVVDSGDSAAAREAAIADRSPHAPCAAWSASASRRGAGLRRRRGAQSRAGGGARDDRGRNRRRGPSANGDKRFERAAKAPVLAPPSSPVCATGTCARSRRAWRRPRLVTPPRGRPLGARDGGERVGPGEDPLGRQSPARPAGAPPTGRRRADSAAWLRKQNGAAVGSGDAFAVKAATGAPVAATRAAASRPPPTRDAHRAGRVAAARAPRPPSAQLAVWRGSAARKVVPRGGASGGARRAGRRGGAAARGPSRARLARELRPARVARRGPTATIARVLDGCLDAVAERAAARPDAPGFSGELFRRHRGRARRSAPGNVLQPARALRDRRGRAARGGRDRRAGDAQMFRPLTYCAADLANAGRLARLRRAPRRRRAGGGRPTSSAWATTWRCASRASWTGSAPSDHSSLRITRASRSGPCSCSCTSRTGRGARRRCAARSAGGARSGGRTSAKNSSSARRRALAWLEDAGRVF